MNSHPPLFWIAAGVALLLGECLLIWSLIYLYTWRQMRRIALMRFAALRQAQGRTGRARILRIIPPPHPRPGQIGAYLFMFDPDPGIPEASFDEHGNRLTFGWTQAELEREADRWKEYGPEA